MFVFNNLGFSLLTFQKCFETSLYFCAIYNKYSLSLLLKNMQTAKGDFLFDNKESLASFGVIFALHWKFFLTTRIAGEVFLVKFCITLESLGKFCVCDISHNNVSTRIWGIANSIQGKSPRIKPIVWKNSCSDYFHDSMRTISKAANILWHHSDISTSPLNTQGRPFSQKGIFQNSTLCGHLQITSASHKNRHFDYRHRAEVLPHNEAMMLFFTISFWFP